MSAVLRATGCDFDVDAFLRATTLKACGVHRRGEPRFPGKQTDSRRHERSGMNIVASDADFNEFTKQVAEATTFLLAQDEEIRRLVTFPGVEAVTLDFGIERRDVVVQSDHFSADLIRVAGALGLSLELSQYPPPDAKDNQSPR
jgi:hypothetical protein